MAVLSPKQREIQEREELVLEAARDLFFEKGYYGLTMARLADRVGCAKGTLYLHFPSKEDLVVELAIRCLARRGAMLRRGLSFRGRTRERVVAVGLASELYTRLYPGDMQILHTMNRILRQEIAPEREQALAEAERRENAWFVELFEEAVRDGDLCLPEDTGAGELAWAFWCLTDGAYRVILSGVSLEIVGVIRPFVSLLRVAHRLADSYGWRPLASEWDYEATQERIRLEIFPEETQKLYAMGGMAAS